ECDVKGALVLIGVILQMRQRRRIARGPRRLGAAERRQRFRCDDPGRDGAAKALAEERSERLRFPLLNVARRPIVAPTEAKQMVPGSPDRDRFAQRIAGPNPDGKLELVIELATRAIARCVLVR